MENVQKNPVKIYIQDIFRVKRTENKYIFGMFGISFKNIMIHGVITSVNKLNKHTLNFEVSDPTGCVEVYYDSSKTQTSITDSNMKHLISSFAAIAKYHDEKVLTMSSLLNTIECKYKKPINIEEGSYMKIIGDIIMDEMKGTRMVCAYVCELTSVERDLLWLEELQYLYKKYYIKTFSVQ